MRESMNDNEAAKVSGGTVVINYEEQKVAFLTLGQEYTYTGVSYKDIWNYVDDLLDQNPQMSDEAFDSYCKRQLKKKGWI